MRFPNVKIKRKIGTMTYYWLRKQEIIIIDPGYEFGDIHVFKKIQTTHSDNLPQVLEKYLDGDELDVVLDVKEIGKDIKSQILEPYYPHH